MNFADKLKAMRKEFGMSQEQLAEKINVSRQAITKWETNGGMPDIENILAIASLFNTSIDELLSGEKVIRSTSEFFYESITQYDIDSKKHYDINLGNVFQVLVQSVEGEKIQVRLASNVLSMLENNYKVKIDEGKNHIDVDLKHVGDVTEAQTKEALYVFISIPSKYMGEAEISATANNIYIRNMEDGHIEYDGKVSSVFMSDFKGIFELTSYMDTTIFCEDINGKIDINQISATSTIHIPKGTSHFSKVKGRSNKIVYTLDNKPSVSSSSEDSTNVIELAGMNSELTINEYTHNPKGTV